MRLGPLWDLVTVAAIMIWVIPLVAQGVIPAWLAVMAIAVLVGAVAAGRRWGRPARDRVRWLLKVGLPVASIAVFIAVYGDGGLEQMGGVLEALAVLFFVLAGLWVMVGAPFRRRR